MRKRSILAPRPLLGGYHSTKRGGGIGGNRDHCAGVPTLRGPNGGGRSTWSPLRESDRSRHHRVLTPYSFAPAGAWPDRAPAGVPVTPCRRRIEAQCALLPIAVPLILSNWQPAEAQAGGCREPCAGVGCICSCFAPLLDASAEFRAQRDRSYFLNRFCCINLH